MYLVHLSPLENQSVFIHFYPFFLKPEPHPQAYEMPKTSQNLRTGGHCQADGSRHPPNQLR